jgi:hypothetical protein
MRIFQAATKIQTLHRTSVLKVRYKKMKVASIMIQKIMRKCVYRKRYIVVRDEARRQADLLLKLATYEVRISLSHDSNTHAVLLTVRISATGTTPSEGTRIHQPRS